MKATYLPVLYLAARLRESVATRTALEASRSEPKSSASAINAHKRAALRLTSNKQGLLVICVAVVVVVSIGSIFPSALP